MILYAVEQVYVILNSHPTMREYCRVKTGCASRMRGYGSLFDNIAAPDAPTYAPPSGGWLSTALTAVESNRRQA